MPAGINGTAGQSASADSSKGTTAAGTQGTGEQSAPQSQTTSSGTAQQTTAPGTDVGQESFFDPETIKGTPLEAAYKQMQGKWTKAMQGFKEGKTKIEAYDSFLAKPIETMQQLANQMGYQLLQRDPNAKVEEEAPKTWADVYARAKKEVLNEIKPLLGEVQQLKQQNVQQYLDSNFSDWRQYEDEMKQTLKAHPSLAHDPDSLYRLAVPAEVFEARATKAALAKLRGTSENGQISGTSTTTKQTKQDEPLPVGSSFNDHVAFAKAKLARDGIKPPG